MRNISDYLKSWGTLRSNRSGMLNSSMAKALAPYDKFDNRKYEEMLRLLDQNPDNLRCVYCNADAGEWDHLVPIMKSKVPTGHGHTFGNLVPACAKCNRSKLTQDWKVFLKERAGENFRTRRAAILRYVRHFCPRRIRRPESTWTELQAIRSEIIRLFEQADDVVRKAGDA